MNSKSTFLLLLSYFILLTNSTAQNDNLPTGKEPGKCYAKCKVPKLDSEIIVFSEYTGVKTNNSTEKYTFEYFPNQIIFIKNNTKDNSDSWEKLYVSLDEPLEYWIVADTSLEKNYKITTLKFVDFEEHTLAKEEWREVLCDSKITTTIVQKLHEKLSNLGFECGSLANTITPKLKTALQQYQIANQLPIGQLNVETLKKLGIKIDP